MDCFKWHLGLSDYLDKTLQPLQEQEMRGHLTTCTSCSLRIQHYHRILERIGADPQAQVLNLPSSHHRPKPSAKQPFGERLRTWIHSQIHNWKVTPWYVKTSVEALAFTLVLVGTFALVPRLRQSYERGLDHQLEMIDVAALSSQPETSAASESESGAETETETETHPSDVDESSPLQVGTSEIWRFNLKTDSPKQARPLVQDLLKHASAQMLNTDASGTEVPGGIQFDVLLPSSKVLTLKASLQEMSKKNSGKEVEQPFSWYKSKHKKPLPENTTRVVIWLPQV